MQPNDNLSSSDDATVFKDDFWNELEEALKQDDDSAEGELDGRQRDLRNRGRDPSEYHRQNLPRR